MPNATPDRASDAAARIAENAVWYHSIEVAPGVVTPGVVDLRGVASRVLPEDLSGRRVIDLGTFDGFWAFEMEARGAASVQAIDLDAIDDAEWPPLHRERLSKQSAEWALSLGKGFELAAELRDSAAKRVISNIYDLSPGVLGEAADFAFCGAILLHLRDPVRALERVRGALTADGELRVFEPISLPLTAVHPRRPAARFQPVETDFNWWVPNLAGLRAWLLAAGFERIQRQAIMRPPAAGQGMRMTYAVLSARPG